MVPRNSTKNFCFDQSHTTLARIYPAYRQGKTKSGMISTFGIRAVRFFNWVYACAPIFAFVFLIHKIVIHF